MYAEVGWVLGSSGTQVQAQIILDPDYLTDYLSVSYDYAFRKIVMLSAKLTILISWSPICTTLILLLALMKLASTSVAVMYNSMENRQPWQTCQVRVKGSDKRPFILVLHWILVYASSTMLMNLSPYLNLWKAEKLKSQWILNILQKDFYSVY